MTVLLGAADRGARARRSSGTSVVKGDSAAEFGVPERLRWLGAVLLGEAAEPDPPSRSAERPRRTLEDSVHRGRW